MAKKIIKAQMKQRCDTFANWAAANPVLLDGELGIVSDDPNLYKVGDGSTAWNALPFRGFDGTLAQELGTSPNAVISQKVVSEKISELSEKIENLPKGEEFDKQGNYPLLHVGTADDLAGRGESVPAEFSFRASGGKSIKDGRAYIKAIKGNSVVWNNAVDLVNMPVDAAGVTATELDGRRIHLQGEFTGEGDRNLYVLDKNNVIEGHYYAVVLQGSKYYGIYGYRGIITDPTDAAIVLATGTGSGLTLLLRTSIDAGTYVDEVVIPQIIDLTLMFGIGNEPTTIEEYNARKPIVADEYAYNEGEVIHCNTESIKSVGDNAWDEEWEKGIIINGENVESEMNIRCKNYIPIIGGEQYHYANKAENYDDYMSMFFYDENKNLIDTLAWSIGTFPTPANARYMRFFINSSYGGVYKNDIILTLVHSGWKSDPFAPYQPYWEDTLPLPIIRKYFPDGMKKAGSAHDEIRYNKASGKWEKVQRIGSVDLGTLTWESAELGGHSAFDSRHNSLGAIYADGIFYLCAKYQPAEHRIYTEGLDKSIALNNGYYGNIYVRDQITIRDTDYTDVESFKASLQGVMLYYELAEPIVTELDEADQNFRDYYKVADFGTEQAVSSKDSAPFKADIIYQFNAVDMIREHEMEITELQKVIATMQAQLASLTNS